MRFFIYIWILTFVPSPYPSRFPPGWQTHHPESTCKLQAAEPWTCWKPMWTSPANVTTPCPFTRIRQSDASDKCLIAQTLISLSAFLGPDYQCHFSTGSSYWKVHCPCPHNRLKKAKSKGSSGSKMATYNASWCTRNMDSELSIGRFIKWFSNMIKPLVCFMQNEAILSIMEPLALLLLFITVGCYITDTTTKW